MTTQEWYIAMATAMQKRNHALTMAAKWQEKAEAAEAEIQQLTQEPEQAQAPVEPVQEQ